ncbi:MAG: type II secretion system protein [Nitrospinota bacterium]|nr:MAG: type II secretion system protein [Nitrospinota bacterium]
MKEKGFTLIEVLIALAILSIAMASIAPVFLSNFAFNNRNELRTGAVAAARQVLDGLRLQNPANLPLSGSTSQEVIAGDKTYTVITKYCLIATYCQSGSRHIRVEVQFHGQKLYTADTVYTQLH